MYHRLFLSALVAVLLSVPGCVQRRARTVSLVDGSPYTFDVVGRMPDPVVNDWGRMRGASVNRSPDGMFWAFMFEPTVDLSRVEVTVVHGYDRAVLVVADTDPQLSDGSWIGRSEPRAIDDPWFRWLKNGRDDLFVFRFDLTAADGRTFSFHQAAMYGAAMDRVFSWM